jgi:hypothetical protein
MILTALISSLTAGYALEQAFWGTEYAVPVSILGGALWGSLVFCIDRLIILGIDKFASPWRIASQIAVRIPFAVIIAVVMSKPFVLRLCQPVIQTQLRKQAHDSMTEEFGLNAQYSGLNAKQKSAQELRTAVDLQRERLKGTPDSFRYKTSVGELSEAENHLRRTQTINLPRIAAASRETERMQRLDRELTAAERSRINSLKQQVDTLRREISRDETAVASAVTEKAAATQQWTENETAKLERLDYELDAAVAAQKLAAQDTVVRNADSEGTIKRLTAPNLVNNYTALRRVTADPKNPDSASTRAFELGLDLLCLALELAVVMSKVLSKKGPLDYATAAAEFLDRERINRDANATAAYEEKVVEVTLAIKEEALNRLRDTQLAQIRAGAFSVASLQQLVQELEQLAA